MMETDVRVIWGGALIVRTFEDSIFIHHGKTTDVVKVLKADSPITHLIELEDAFTDNPLVTVERNGTVRKWDIAGGWCNTLRSLQQPCKGMLYVKEFGGWVTYGEAGDVFIFNTMFPAGWRLNGPKAIVYGAVYVKDFGGLVTYGGTLGGDYGEAFLFRGPQQEGQSLKGSMKTVYGMVYVKELGGLVTYGFDGDVHLFEDPMRACRSLLGPSKTIKGASYVKEFGCLVTYGHDGEAFLFNFGGRIQDFHNIFTNLDHNADSKVTKGEIRDALATFRLQDLPPDLKAIVENADDDASGTIDHKEFLDAALPKNDTWAGRRLQGPKGSVQGAAYVKELRGLVTYGNNGEVFWFRDKKQQVGRQLHGPTQDITGAITVKELGGLVTYGFRGEVFLFHNMDVDGQCLMGPAHRIDGAIYMKEQEGLVTYGCSGRGPYGEVFLFKSSYGQEGQRIMRPSDTIAGAIYVKDFTSQLETQVKENPRSDVELSRHGGYLMPDRWENAGLVTYARHGGVFFTSLQVDSHTLKGPEKTVCGAIYIKEIGLLVTYGFGGEIFLFEGIEQAGVSLRGPTKFVNSVAYVPPNVEPLHSQEFGGCLVSCGGNMKGGEGEVFLFKTGFEQEGQRMGPPTMKSAYGAYYVKNDIRGLSTGSLKGLVTFGFGGEVFLFERMDSVGKRLVGPGQLVRGVVYVKMLGGLVTFGGDSGGRGEVFLFKSSEQVGEQLKGPKHPVYGIIWIKEFDALVTYGDHGEVHLFKRTGHEGQLLRGPTELINGAVYLKQLGGLVTYGQDGQAFLFQGHGSAGCSTIGRKLNSHIKSDIVRVFSMGKSVVFQGGPYLEIFLPQAFTSERLQSMMVQHTGNVCLVEQIDDNHFLTVTDSGELHWDKDKSSKCDSLLKKFILKPPQVLCVKDLDNGFLGVGPYAKQASISLVDIPHRFPLLAVKCRFCLEIALMVTFFVQLAGFAAGVSPTIHYLDWLKHSHHLPIPGIRWVARSMKVELIKEEASISVTIIALLHWLEHIQQRLMTSSLVLPGIISQDLIDFLNLAMQIGARPLFLPLLRGTLKGIPKEEKASLENLFWLSVYIIAASSLFVWVHRVTYIEFAHKWTSFLEKTQRPQRCLTWDKRIHEVDLLVRRRHPLSRIGVDLEVTKVHILTLLCLIDLVFAHWSLPPVATATLNLIVGGIFLQMAWTRADYFSNNQRLNGNSFNRAAAASIAVTYACSWLAAVAEPTGILRNRAVDCILTFLNVVLIIVVVYLVLRDSTEETDTKALPISNQLSSKQAIGVRPKDLQARWVDLQTRMNVLDSDFDDLEEQLDRILLRIPLLNH